MLIGTSAKVNDGISVPPISYNNEVVEDVLIFKYLGVMLDLYLTFDHHVNYLRKKVVMKLKTLGRIRQCIRQRLALYLYKNLVVPDFVYADQVYDVMSKTNADTL